MLSLVRVDIMLEALDGLAPHEAATSRLHGGAEGLNELICSAVGTEAFG